MTIETILCADIGVRAARAALAVSPGQSLTLRSQDPSKKVSLVHVGAAFSADSAFFVHSPRLHDNVNGINFDVQSNVDYSSFINGIVQPLFQQDNLQVDGGIGGGAAIWDTVALSIFYEDIVGSPGNLFHWDQIKPRIKNIMNIPIAANAGAVGQWELCGNLIAVTDLTKANTDYAILGGSIDDRGALMGVIGPCTGNVILGIPVMQAAFCYGNQYLIDLSILSGLPCIPVFHSADKAGTFVWLSNRWLAARLTNLIVAELDGTP